MATRRIGVGAGLALAVVVTVAMVAGGEAGAASRRAGRSAETVEGVVPAAPVSPEARRQWALARMNETAAERRRCPERFRTLRDVQECEARLSRQLRAYNEIYIEASR